MPTILEAERREARHASDDPALAAMVNLAPKARPVLKRLRSDLGSKESAHGCFWLQYLDKYAKLAREFEETLEDEAQRRIHVQGIREWISEVVLPAVSNTEERHVFVLNSKGELQLGAAAGWFRRLRLVNDDNLDQHVEFLMQLPTEVASLGSPRT